MSKKQKALVVVASVSCALLVASAVIASSLPNTPLYTVRMEQASSRMNFLQTAVNGFTYTAENGYTVNYNAAGYCGDVPLEITVGRTCEGTCDIDPTCPNTCWSTCDDPTCGDTCPNTCEATCDTCSQTCDTCPQTCIGPTCEDTCEAYCTIISCVICP